MSGKFILRGVQRVGWGQEAGPREEAKRTRGPRIPALGGMGLREEHCVLDLGCLAESSRSSFKQILPTTCNAHAKPDTIHMNTEHMCLTSAPPCKAHAATQPTILACLLERPPPGTQHGSPFRWP